MKQNYRVRLTDINEEELCNKNGFFRGQVYLCDWKSLNKTTSKMGYQIKAVLKDEVKFITIYANEFEKV